MVDSELEVILQMAQKLNPQIESGLKYEIDEEKLRQLPAERLGCEVARFQDEQGLEPIASGDWMQQNWEIWLVGTGILPSVEDGFVLPAFAGDRVFRPECAI